MSENIFIFGEALYGFQVVSEKSLLGCTQKAQCWKIHFWIWVKTDKLTFMNGFLSVPDVYHTKKGFNENKQGAQSVILIVEVFP